MSKINLLANQYFGKQKAINPFFTENKITIISDKPFVCGIPKLV